MHSVGYRLLKAAPHTESVISIPPGYGCPIAQLSVRSVKHIKGQNKHSTLQKPLLHPKSVTSESFTLADSSKNNATFKK